MSTAVVAIPTTFARRVTTLFPADIEDGLYYRIYRNLADGVVIECKDREGRGRERTATVTLSTLAGGLAGNRGDRHIQAGRYRIPLTEDEFTNILGWL